MLSTCPGVAAGGRPGEGKLHRGYTGAHLGQEKRQGLGVQEWPDGSRYEGDFVSGLKHGKGKYTWANGEYYKGSFYKDYRHGEGVHCWPTGHKFTGKFYLNRKEGYGLQLLPDGTMFQGLYHADQRFGPGVVSYPDGRQDVGLWHRERLLRLCTSIEWGFSLNNFPEYAAYMDSAAIIRDPLTQVETDPLLSPYRDLQSDEGFILPPDMEIYSTDGDHLPLPPGRRKELDQHFHGELWEPNSSLYQGYDRDPLSTLPLLPRMQAHIHTHRLQALSVGWDVAAVLSLSRDGFGTKGPLEISSELLIQQASLGERQAVSQSLRTGLVHPDVADTRGHTALIAATVNCHNDVIHLLLDRGADIDKLNCEGMSALAVCLVLYYPIQSLHTTVAEEIQLEPLPETLPLKAQSTCGSSPDISAVDFSTDTTRANSRPQSSDTALSNQTNQTPFSDQTTEELTEQIASHRSMVSDDSDHGFSTDLHSDLLDRPETSADSQCGEEDERDEEDGEQEEGEEKEAEREGKVDRPETSADSQRGEEDERDEEDGELEEGEEKEPERGGKVQEMEEIEQEREVKTGKVETEIELGEGKETEAAEEDVDKTEDIERVEGGGEERFIQVFDGDIPLGSVPWKEGGAKAAGTPQHQHTPEEGSLTPSFDSNHSVESFHILVTEEAMQRSAEGLSRTGIPQHTDTQETVCKMAAMKIEHRARWNTLKLLLDRGADPNASRVPMPVLFLAVKAADTEAVRRLVLCGARTDIPLPPEKKGLYPLHIAAGLPGPAGPRITELLLHALSDPDTQANDQDEIYEQDKIAAEMQVMRGNNKRAAPKSQGPTTTFSLPSSKAPVEGGRTALHVACQRDSDYIHASEVVALLLSHGASTDLLWSGHSPLSLAIASGNDLAVKELLKGGADPNLPLSRGVGSALCALANINYHSGGHPHNKTKLLDMLVKAGADMLMPVMVGEVLGTVVDYAHYAFKQDSRIANTPFHALSMREREIFNARRRLLSMMGDLLRQAAVQRERERLEKQQHLEPHSTSSSGSFVYTGAGAIPPKDGIPGSKTLPHVTETQRRPLFKYCYQCGRSVSVVLTACSRCHQVYYCSTACKLQAWEERHKDECIRVSAREPGTQLSARLKSQRTPRPLSTARRSTAQKISEWHGTAQKVSESHPNLKETYSSN
ncbi:ankyrin repeat and MYND domain-containing protein 1 isoform X2 [Myripristis murdjan]|uniref:ankyrin repeat and MYND domain-containing protein 1 isoform X2 n=1 Tax=Myripristis murdjan TaxID=586833 RepID=UPI001176416C|nr:ankyrin repeat and MYND domain-containing protein 1-like isoform X2 [Myripristis murdjan]